MKKRTNPGVRVIGVIAFMLILTGRSVPPSREEIEADAKVILLKCKADRLLSVSTDDALTIRIKPLKTPAMRTERDLKAIRCVGRQWTDAIDFRPAAELLLTLKAPLAQPR